MTAMEGQWDERVEVFSKRGVRVMDHVDEQGREAWKGLREC